MQHDDTEGKAIHTRAELLNLIRTSMGGRAAEILYYGPQEGLASGACGDLQNATRRALRLLCSYGMDERFGMAAIDIEKVNMADADSPVRQAVNDILQTELDRAVSILSENRSKVDALVAVLMEKNHLSGKEIDAVLRAAE
jgi:ATP-dependent Zn protease